MAVASTVSDAASAIAKDENNVYWQSADMLKWVNDAQRAVCSVRPDACAERVIVQLSQGTRQSITGRRLVRVTANVTDANGSSPSRTPRVVDFQDLVNGDVNWISSNTGTIVDEIAYDEREPQIFWVNPGSDGNFRYLETIQATNPTELTALTDSLSIDDVYIPAMIEWVLYRMYSYESDLTPTSQRALVHYRSFFNLMREKLTVDMVETPNVESVLGDVSGA